MNAKHETTITPTTGGPFGPDLDTATWSCTCGAVANYEFLMPPSAERAAATHVAEATSESPRLVDALVAAGWHIDGRGHGYVRLGRPPQPGTVTVPTDPTAPEYRELMAATMGYLANLADAGEAARTVLDAMHREGVSP